jgi:uncharacterized SAM-binding protein YcdF (DUF218 family)
LPDEQIPRVDIIVVLTGGRKRLKDAVRFLQAGKGEYLFISGVGTEVTLKSILKANELENLPQYLRDRILLGDDSRSTVENSVEVRNIMVRTRAKSILLVTSNYHMRRSIRLFRSELERAPLVEAKIYPYPVKSPNFSPDNWWLTPVGWQILLSEYLKSLPYRFFW